MCEGNHPCLFLKLYTKEFKINTRYLHFMPHVYCLSATPINWSTLVTYNFQLLRVKNAASSCFHEYCFDSTHTNLTAYISTYEELILFCAH